MSFGRTNSLSVIGATHLDFAMFLRSFARDSLPKKKYGEKTDIHKKVKRWYVSQENPWIFFQGLLGASSHLVS